MLTVVTLQFPKVFDVLKPKKMVTKLNSQYLRGYSTDNIDMHYSVIFQAPYLENQ